MIGNHPREFLPLQAPGAGPGSRFPDSPHPFLIIGPEERHDVAHIEFIVRSPRRAAWDYPLLEHDVS